MPLLSAELTGRLASQARGIAGCSMKIGLLYSNYIAAVYGAARKSVFTGFLDSLLIFRGRSGIAESESELMGMMGLMGLMGLMGMMRLLGLMRMMMMRLLGLAEFVGLVTANGQQIRYLLK